MIDQGLLISTWLTWHDIWKHTLYPKTLCKSRYLSNEIKDEVCKTVRHLAKSVHPNIITLFSNKNYVD